MADEREVPEADALEQRIEAGEDAATDDPSPAEANEADAMEQHQSAGGRAVTSTNPRIGNEVPEADAVEQSQVVGGDDDDRSE